MDKRSDNDVVIEHTVRLERLLKESYGATGTGLGTLLMSVADKVPENLVKEGRRIAGMRNKVVHEHVPLKNRRDFIRRCESLEKQLSRLAPAQSGDVGEVRSSGALSTVTEWIGFINDHFYWHLLVVVVLLAVLQLANGLAKFADPARVIFDLATVDLSLFFVSSLLLALFLFLKNFFPILLGKNSPGFFGSISKSLALGLFYAPVLLARMIFTSSLIGTSVAVFLFGYLLMESLPNSSVESLEDFFGLQFHDQAEAEPYVLASEKILAGSGLVLFYVLSSIHRHFHGHASGHAAAALLLCFLGIRFADFPLILVAPMALLAFMDIYGLARDGRLMTLPKDPVRQEVSSSPANRQQRRSMNSDNGEQDSVSSPFRAEKPRYNFSHVVGMADLKARLGEAGREIINARRGGVAARNGILLFGPPGTGKTFFAEALAGELRLKIIKANFGQTASRWVNQTTEQVMAVFREAEQQAPVVLFMDEIDTILIDRSKVSNADSEAARLVSAFLPAIERLRARGVVVIGATNLLDQLDPAAIREGRFDFKIEVPYPDEEARFAILKERVIKAGLTTHTETLQRLARRWSGFSVARMHAIVDEAARMGIDGTPADFDDFMAALRKVQGRKGARGEGGPTLEQLTLSPHMREVLEDIAGRMKNIEAIERLGGSLPRGVLFFGPPGTGKTFTARALANSADWAFLATTGHDLLANPKKIDEIMHEASDLRPCIVFIDEADDVFGHRSFSNAASITNKLLTAMDGANGRLQDVVFIAATNHPDNFDPAALRGGRFTEKVEFELPGREALRDHIQKWIDTARAPIHPDVSAQAVADLMLGHPLATVNEALQAAVNRMASKAAGRGEVDASIGMDDIREGFRRVAGLNGE